MIDPRPLFPAQAAAYALPQPVLGLNVVDVILGDDLTGPVPYGLIVREADGSFTVSIRGTDDTVEWVEDFDVEPVDTSVGTMARGIAVTFGSLRTSSGRPLPAYAPARVQGHSRGAPIALALSAAFGWPAVLYACPKLVGADVIAKAKIDTVWHVNGDIVPDVSPTFPGLPNVVRIPPPPGIGLLDVSGHHVFSTYQAAINATLT